MRSKYFLSSKDLIDYLVKYNLYEERIPVVVEVKSAIVTKWQWLAEVIFIPKKAILLIPNQAISVAQQITVKELYDLITKDTTGVVDLFVGDHYVYDVIMDDDKNTLFIVVSNITDASNDERIDKYCNKIETKLK